MRSSDSLAPSVYALVPLAQTYHCSGYIHQDVLRPQPTVERQGLPGYWVIPFIRATVKHPAESDIPIALHLVLSMLLSGKTKP